MRESRVMIRISARRQGEAGARQEHNRRPAGCAGLQSDMLRYGMGCAILLMSALSCVPIRPTPETSGGGTASAAARPAEASAAIPESVAAAPAREAVKPAPAQAADPGQEAFEMHVLPILQDRC